LTRRSNITWSCLQSHQLLESLYDKKMLSLRVGMRFDDATTVFQSLYGIVVRGELMWEFFSWSSDEEDKNDFLVSAQ
jgi:hypothetical protein